jgi:hypothetical protein
MKASTCDLKSHHQNESIILKIEAIIRIRELIEDSFEKFFCIHLALLNDSLKLKNVKLLKKVVPTFLLIYIYSKNL